MKSKEDPRAIEKLVDAVVVRLARSGTGYPSRAFIRHLLDQLETLPTWVSPIFIADLVEVGFRIAEETHRDR